MANRNHQRLAQSLADWLIILLWGGVSIGLALFYKAGLLGTKDLINFEILWLTAIAVLRYTKETYHLRALAKFQLDHAQAQTKEMDETRMNEFLPILVPAENGHIQGNQLNVEVKNSGRGIAREIKVHLGGVEVMSDFSLAPGESAKLKIEQNSKEVTELTEKQQPAEIYLEVRYKDIYDRSFRTIDIVFYREDGQKNRYSLVRGRWKFQ